MYRTLTYRPYTLIGPIGGGILYEIAPILVDAISIEATGSRCAI